MKERPGRWSWLLGWIVAGTVSLIGACGGAEDVGLQGEDQRDATTTASVVPEPTMAGCQPTWFGRPTTPRVVVLGNSITALSQDEIIAEMSDTFQVSVSAESGCTASQAQDLADAYVGSNAWCVVVDIGSNDWPSDNVGAVFDRLQAIERDLQAPCFIVATLAQHTVNPELNSFAATFNFFLAFGTGWGTVDYDAIVRDWTATTDSLHPNEHGQVLYARAIDQAVKGELWS